MAGEALTAAPGAWEPDDVALAYQWSANGEAIVGAMALLAAGAIVVRRRRAMS